MPDETLRRRLGRGEQLVGCLEADMPLVEVTLAEGRTPAQIRALLHELHAAVVRAVDAARPACVSSSGRCP